MFFKQKNDEMWKTDIDTEMKNEWRSLPEGVFYLSRNAFVMWRDLKIAPMILNIMSLYSSSIHIRKTMWRVAKTTNRRSKRLSQTKKVSAVGVVEQQCSVLAYFWMSIFLQFFPPIHHTHCPVSILARWFGTVGCLLHSGMESKSKWQFKWDSPNGWHEFQWLQPFKALALGILHHIKFTLNLLNLSG